LGQTRRSQVLKDRDRKGVAGGKKPPRVVRLTPVRIEGASMESKAKAGEKGRRAGGETSGQEKTNFWLYSREQAEWTPGRGA